MKLSTLVAMGVFSFPLKFEGWGCSLFYIITDNMFVITLASCTRNLLRL